METIAIIPARGGSKSILRKNVKILAGKPLIAWVIETSIGSRYLSRIIVTTDDEEIAGVARQYGAETPFIRPAELAGDLSTTHETIVHTLEWLAKHEGYSPDLIVLLPPTAPLVTSEDIDQGIEIILQEPDSDSVRPVIESHKHPFKTFSISDGVLKPFFTKEVTGFDEPYDMPRQLFPKAYVYSGTFQVVWPSTIIKMKSLSGKKMGHFFMKDDHAVNIDSLQDFDYADTLMRKRLKEETAEHEKKTTKKKYQKRGR